LQGSFGQKTIKHHSKESSRDKQIFGLVGDRVMVFNATFNNILVIVAVSFFDGGNRSSQRKPPTCRK
jgi:hypothetical protein